MKLIARFSAAILSFTLLGIFGLKNLVGQQGADNDDMQERMRAPLVSAGIPINEASLVATISSQDKRIATSAAYVLGTFPKTPRSTQALLSVINDSDEILAMASMYSLLKLGNTDWQSMAEQRLPDMRDPVVQIQVAGILARAGSAKGWPLVLNTIKNGRLAQVGLDNVGFFDGLKLDTSHFIDVIGELEQLLAVAPPEALGQIDSKIRELKLKRGQTR